MNCHTAFRFGGMMPIPHCRLSKKPQLVVDRVCFPHACGSLNQLLCTTLHLITFNIALHTLLSAYFTFHILVVHSISLRYITSHLTTLCCTTLCVNPSPLHSTLLHYILPKFPLHCVTLHLPELIFICQTRF